MVRGVGFADAATRRRADPETLFRIASITKTFTATAVMQLRDEGLLDLDDPAVAHLPELHSSRSPFGPLESLTIRRMLSHESGLQGFPPGADWTYAIYEGSAERNLERATEIAITVPPSSQWKYSNLAYQLLGEIVARIAGVPYASYVQSRILDPLQMEATAFDPLPDSLTARRATGYAARFLSDGFEIAPEQLIALAEAGLWSCVCDLARWISFQFGGRTEGSAPAVLAPTTLGEMHRPRYLQDDAWTRAWGIGWCAMRRDDVIWVWHSGGVYGFRTAVSFDPKEKVGAIALINGVGVAIELALQLATIARNAVREAGPSVELPPTMPEEWRPLLGLYLLRDFGLVLRLEWRDGKLTFLDPEDKEWSAMLAPTETADLFIVEAGVREAGEPARFNRNADGRVVSVFLAAATYVRLDAFADDETSPPLSH